MARRRVAPGWPALVGRVQGRVSRGRADPRGERPISPLNIASHEGSLDLGTNPTWPKGGTSQGKPNHGPTLQAGILRPRDGGVTCLPAGRAGTRTQARRLPARGADSLAHEFPQQACSRRLPGGSTKSSCRTPGTHRGARPVPPLTCPESGWRDKWTNTIVTTRL